MVLKQKAMTVSEVNGYIGRWMGRDPILQALVVEGEVSNATVTSGGQMYFSLKDDAAKISCVVFRLQLDAIGWIPEHGERICVKGMMRLYAKEGRYQIDVTHMEPVGQGDIHLQFERVKKELGAMGYFDQSRKRALPKFPGTIGIVTSRTGAVIRDIEAVYKRRSTLSALKVYPVTVQGERAPADIAAAFDYFNTHLPVDVIILARGGGALEDLNAFNDVRVARAIFESKCPVVTGIGHETDTTISDFVADVRAATPSAAAERVVHSAQELQKELARLLSEGKNGVQRIVDFEKLRLSGYSPDTLHQLLEHKMEMRRRGLHMHYGSLVQSMRGAVQEKKSVLDTERATLHALSPLNVLSRGYGIVQREGVPIISVSRVQVGEDVEVILADGRLTAQIQKIVPDASTHPKS